MSRPTAAGSCTRRCRSNTFTPGVNADIWLLGITFVEIAALSFAVEITVSILKMRAPGMSLDRMPIFGWYILVTALMMLVAFPPLILASILLECERAFGLPFFDPTRGGDALLWQHLFWLFGHPDVYIIFLPMAAVLSTLIPVFAGRPLVGYRTIVVAIIALAFLSFGIWVHHMFTVGIPHLALAFFSAGSAIVAVPTAVQVFAWLATLAHGRPRWNVPMLYIFGFFFIFALGGLTGVMLAIVPFDWQAHDTYFVVAHLHYVVAGAFAFPLLAALYYWLPLLTGRAAVHQLLGAGVLADLHRLQPDLFPDASGRPARHAATYLHLYGVPRLDRDQPVVLGGRVHHDDRLRPAGDRPGGAASLRTAGAARPVAGHDAGMGDADAACALQFRLDPPRRVAGRPGRPGDARASPGARRGLPRIHAQRLAGDARRAHDERRARSADRAAARDLSAAVDRARHRNRGAGVSVQSSTCVSLAAALVVAGLFVLGARKAPASRATTVRCRSVAA